MALAITSISHKRNYNKKSINVVITGTDFPAIPTNLYLLPEGGGAADTVLITDYTVVSPTKITADLRLVNARKRLYDLIILDGITPGTLEDAFRVQS